MLIDKRRFVAMVEAQSPTCYRVARAILRNHEDCRDALQEAILKAWAARHKLRDEALFATWLTRIVIRECRNLQRRGRKYDLAAEVEPAQSQAAHAASDTWDALDALPDKLRLPLILHHVEGYAIQEIAGMLHLPQSTVRGRLYQARGAMRLELTDEEGVTHHDA